MAVAYFCFNAELNYFLPKHQKQVKISHYFEERNSIKDTIESFGIPHTEVNSIEVNGEYVNFSYIIQDEDNINVYPISASLNTSSISLRPKAPSVIRFVLDVHLGKLATSLRLLGFDTLYSNDYGDEELAQISSNQERILLTRDKGLLMRSLVTHGYYVRNTQPQQQILEVMQRFDLFTVVSPFKRCLRCNGLLVSVDKESVIDQLPANIELQINEFHRCQDCTQIYWKGSHYTRLQNFIAEIMGRE
ncbi:Mut7-C ubiquitin/RNAse domain-containing protein [Anabaena sphaerica FACHB-251]|uniref:Mut7-C ubiquitin/RNAse domain-containing protein n=1 Tax=Anabaena sphaerica FACHB-251 TaxID=2692883 RepID=A0A926WE50_9NOST|nr:Mut7-C RNAse domain-containing protein [Anabaena sphaerica]MBD2292905.1 Mut7-C ubiquitin/RNAse domain-containing protein [Anabaena sphaerica FACHB-251]